MPAVRFRDTPEVAWDLVVRVGSAFTIEETRAELAAALRTLPPESGPLGSTEKQIIHAQPFADAVVGDVRSTLLMLGGAVLLMLMVAGVNVANLLLARGLARRRELSVRAAVGATRRRILRQLATEAMVLSAAGAVLGILVAHLSLSAFLALAPPELPRVAQIAIDARALGLLRGRRCGRRPVRSAARIADGHYRTRGGASGTREQCRVRDAPVRLRHGLVVAQIAVATFVLSTAGLLGSSLSRLQRLDPGFAARDVVLADVAIPSSRYADAAALQRAMVRLAAHAATRPGISNASAVVTPPFAGTGGVDATVFAEGQTIGESASPLVNYEGTDSTYFATLGLPILQGRGIDERDREGSELVVVVNLTFARCSGRAAILSADASTGWSPRTPGARGARSSES